MPLLTNPKEEAFAQAIFRGETGTDAYAAQFPTASRKTAGEKASRWAKRDRIKARIAEFTAEIERAGQEASKKLVEQVTHTLKTALLTMQRRRELIAERVKRKKVTDAALCNLLRLDALLAGDLIEKIDHTTDGQPLPSVAPQITIEVSPHWNKPRTGA